VRVIWGTCSINGRISSRFKISMTVIEPPGVFWKIILKLKLVN
jgi:hypothetical protein